MGILTRAAGFINTKLGQAGGIAINYVRGGTTIEIAAADGLVWLGDARFGVTTDGGPRVVFGDRQYLITAGSLGSLGEPEEGDRIIETIDDTEYTFEVMQPGTGDPAVRWSDPARSRWRVNAKRV